VPPEIGPEWTGAGVAVAVLDSGIAPHPDLEGRLLVSLRMTEEDGSGDLSGHGTHGDGIVASSGRRPRGRFRGIAPGFLGFPCTFSKGMGQG
jgi:serine protease AprX